MIARPASAGGMPRQSSAAALTFIDAAIAGCGVRSRCLDTGGFYDARVVLGLFAHVSAEFGRRHIQRFTAEFGKLIAHVGSGNSAHRVFGNFVDDLSRSARRRPQAEPEREVE